MFPVCATHARAAHAHAHARAKQGKRAPARADAVFARCRRRRRPEGTKRSLRTHGSAIGCAAPDRSIGCCMSSVPRCLLHGVGFIMSAARCPFRVGTVSAACRLRRLLHVVACIVCHTLCAATHKRTHAATHARAHAHTRAHTRVREHADRYGEERRRRRRLPRRRTRCGPRGDQPFVRMSPTSCSQDLSVCVFVGCTVVGCTVAWLRLVRCNVVRRALSAPRRLSHVVPMHQFVPLVVTGARSA